MAKDVDTDSSSSRSRACLVCLPALCLARPWQQPLFLAVSVAPCETHSFPNFLERGFEIVLVTIIALVVLEFLSLSRHFALG